MSTNWEATGGATATVTATGIYIDGEFLADDPPVIVEGEAVTPPEDDEAA